jgi:prefoldin alpha subunit
MIAMTDKMIQRKYMQLQMIKQQLQIYAEEKKLIDEKVNELAITLDALQKLGTVSAGDEMWTPIGSGGYVSASMKDLDNVLIGIGAGIFIREKREVAIERMQKILEEISALNNNVVSEMTKFAKQGEALEMEIQQLAQRSAEKKK